MKIHKLFTLIGCMALVSLSGQETPEGLDYAGEVSKMVPLPVSPEAAAFMTYGNTPVNLYTGTPDINIPLYTFQGREMALPISLSYDAGGIRVEQQATWVGLGWNLNVGGRITRIANGLPDDFFTGQSGGLNGTSGYNTLFTANAAQLDLWLGYKNLGYGGEFDTTAEVFQYFDFLEDINNNEIDVQPDYFSINVPGLSDYIVIDYDSGTPTAMALKNPRVSVSYVTASNEGITGWTVTNEDGTVYHFSANAREYTYQQIDESPGNGPKYRRYTSSWMLTKIESPNKKDTYDLYYTPSGFWLQPFPAALVGHITNTLDGNASANTYSSGNYVTTSSSTQINQQFLNSIEHNNELIVSMSLKNRSDLALNTNSALDEILIHEYGSLSDHIKRIKLDHGYFGDPSSSQPVMDWRLKLDGIDIKGGDQTTYETYGFDYEQAGNLPSKNSTSQDYLGFYNGKGNTVLYPQYAAGIDTYEGADLSPDIDLAKIGLLTKMTYPTGGYTEFVYESDSTWESGSSSGSGSYIVEKTYAAASLMGGNVADNPYCFAYCNDKYQGDPAYRKSNFTVPEDAGDYILEYTKSGGGTAEATLYVDSPIIDYKIADPNNTFIWNSNGSSETKSLQLQAGTNYAIFLVNGGEGSSNGVRIYRDSTVVVGGGGSSSQNNLRAGLRVASILDYTDQGQLAKHRDYTYTQGLNSDVSSGRAIYQPLLAYVSRLPNGTEVLHRLAGGSGGQQPHVVYERVYEVVKDIDNPGLSAPIGYTQYEFYTGSDGITTSGGAPFFNNFVSEYEVGKEKRVTVFDANDQAVDLTENTYADFSHFSTTGMALMVDSNYQHFYVNIYKASNNKWRYRRVEGEVSGQGSVNFGLPDICFQPDNSCMFNAEYASYVQRITGASGRYGAPVSVRTTRYLESGDVVGETQMTYTDGNGVERHILKERSTVDSKGDTLRTTYYHPDDNVAQGSGLLTAKNRLAEVVKTESYRNGELLYSREQEYVQNGDAVLPKVIKSLKGDNAPGTAEQRILLEYDARANLQESAIIVADDPQAGQDYVTGPGTVYIWGYNDLYPVAKVENATTAQVAALSGFNGDLDIGLALALTTQQEDQLRSLPGALVTTYTYDPLVGVTSITDPRGYTVRYEYDGFNRLKAVRDGDDNLVTDYEYRYKNQQ